METIEQFQAKQMAELEKKRAELAELSKLGDIPGLTPWLVYGHLYGVRHIGFKLVDLAAFIAWARENCDPVLAIEGGPNRYCLMYPHIPETRDYEGSRSVDSGGAKIEYSSIMRRYQCNVFTRGFRISFELPAKHVAYLTPIPQFKTYSDRYHGKRQIERWCKPQNTIKQYLREGVDKQSANLESLVTFDQLVEFFGKSE